MDSWFSTEDMIVHVGVHKTGTTSLQSKLSDGRSWLSQNHKICYPGKGSSQFRASLAFTGRKIGWEGRTAPIRHWTALLKELENNKDSRLLISSEAFCEMDSEKTQELVETLKKTTGKNIKIILAVRPLDKIAPSSWQQYIKSGLTLDYEPWLENLLSEHKQATPSFWKRNNYVNQINKWIDSVGTQNLKILIPDSTNHEQLYIQVAGLLGIEEDHFLALKEEKTNRSMTRAETLVILETNKLLKNNINFEAYNRLVRFGAILDTVENHKVKPEEAKIHTPQWALDKMQIKDLETYQLLTELPKENVLGPVLEFKNHKTEKPLEKIRIEDLAQAGGSMLANAVKRGSNKYEDHNARRPQVNQIPTKMLIAELKIRLKKKLKK